MVRSEEVTALSVKTIRDRLGWEGACQCIDELPLVTCYHPNELEENNFSDIVEKCQRIRVSRFKKYGKKGELSLGDRLLLLTVSEIQKKGREQYGMDWVELTAKAQRDNEATNKDWTVNTLLKAMAEYANPDSEDGTDKHEESLKAKHQLEVLNICPCPES